MHAFNLSHFGILSDSHLRGNVFLHSAGDEKTVQCHSLHGEIETIKWVTACRGDIWVFVLGFGLVSR